MKKNTRKLAVHKEVVRTLGQAGLREVAGGAIILSNNHCVEKTTFCGGASASCTIGE
jgi:hypothetical protein